MIGAIIGDVAGSIYEFANIKTKEFPLIGKDCEITDDSLMTIAVGRALLRTRDGNGDLSTALIEDMHSIGNAYPNPMGGYGGRFGAWLANGSIYPYNSYGNGSAMRASPCGEIADSLEEALRLAKASAEVTHNHAEGVKGAQATAAAVYMARNGADMAEIREYIMQNFYDVRMTVDEIRPGYRFEDSCQRTVPQAIVAFLDSVSFEDALRNAISLGGDSDTLTDITCAIAWAYYARDGIDETMAMLRDTVLQMLPEDLLATVTAWERLFGGLPE